VIAVLVVDVTSIVMRMLASLVVVAMVIVICDKLI